MNIKERSKPIVSSIVKLYFNYKLICLFDLYGISNSSHDTKIEM